MDPSRLDELGEVVRANRESGEDLDEVFGEDDVAGNHAHEADLETVFSAVEPVLGPIDDDPLVFVDRTIAGTGDFARCAVERNTHFGKEGLKAP